MLIDPVRKRQIARISLIYYGAEHEPELIYFADDRCIFIDNMGNVYELFIEI